MSAIEDLKDAAWSVVNKQEKVQSQLLGFEIDILHDALNLVYGEGGEEEAYVKHLEGIAAHHQKALDNYLTHTSQLTTRIEDLQKQLEEHKTHLEALCILANHFIKNEAFWRLGGQQPDAAERAFESEKALQKMIKKVQDELLKVSRD